MHKKLQHFTPLSQWTNLAHLSCIPKGKSSQKQTPTNGKTFPCIRCNSNLTLEPRRLYRFFKESNRSFKWADCFVSAICLPWRILCSTSGFSSLRILYKCYNENVIRNNFFSILCSSLDIYIFQTKLYLFFCL